MKNKILVSALIATGLFLVTLQISTLSAQTTKAKSVIVQTTKYACPHHPDKISDKPGKCECGMDLVELKANDKEAAMKSSGKNIEKKGMKKDMKKMDKEKVVPESREMQPMDNKMMKKDSVKMMKDKM